MTNHVRLLLLGPLVSALLACGGGAPFSEVEPAITRYLGQAVTAEEGDAGAALTWIFDPESGPVCMRGDDYSVSLRPGTDPSKLLVFLQGGGACWSELCLAYHLAPPGVPETGVLDPADPDNPFADWNVLYLPYCDGSLFIGDVSVDADQDGTVDRVQHGLQNLSAGLDVARVEVPDATHVVLGGASAGGFATIPATMLVRLTWPEARLDVFDDSGVGVARAGEPDYLETIFDDFDAWDLLPSSCHDCYARGHLTDLLDWQLRQDPNLKLAGMSSHQDAVISQTFLGIEPADFQDSLFEEVTRLETAWPGRYAGYLTAGADHTVVLSTPASTAIDGVTAYEWLAGLVDDTGAWRPLRDPPN